MCGIIWTLTDPQGRTQTSDSIVSDEPENIEEDLYWVSWTPQETGTYQLRAAVWAGSENGRPTGEQLTAESAWDFEVVDSYIPEPEILGLISYESPWSLKPCIPGRPVVVRWGSQTLRPKVSTANDPAPLAYQWASRVPGTQTFADMPGATDAALVRDAADITHGIEYECRVTNTQTGQSALSEIATVLPYKEFLQQSNITGCLLSNPEASPSALWHNEFGSQLTASVQSACTVAANGETVTFSAEALDEYGSEFQEGVFDSSSVRCTWESAPGAGGPFTPVAGADSTSATLTVTADANTAGTFYRATLVNTEATDPKPFTTNAIGINVEMPVLPSDFPQPAPDADFAITAGPAGLGNILTGITAGNAGSTTSVESMLSQFTVPDGTTVEIAGADGTAVSPSSPISTGSKVVLTDASGAREEITVVVAGDVTGSGVMSLTQLVRLAQAFTGQKPLEGPYLAAGDMTGTGSITLSDLVREAQLLTSAA